MSIESDSRMDVRLYDWLVAKNHMMAAVSSSKAGDSSRSALDECVRRGRVLGNSYKTGRSS